MLVLKRKDRQEIEITHRESGDVIKIRVYKIQAGFPGRLTMAFEDDANNFAIHRPERQAKLQSTTI